MSLEEAISGGDSAAKTFAEISIFSRNCSQRYSQKITYDLLVVAEAAAIAVALGVVLYTSRQVQGDSQFAMISALGAGAILLASHMWTRAGSLDRFESRFALLPGAVVTSAFTAAAAKIGGASWAYALTCAVGFLAAVYLVRIPTLMLSFRWLKTGKLTRLTAIVADNDWERQEVTTALGRRPDIGIVFSGTSAEASAQFGLLRSFAQENMLDEIVLAGQQVDASLINQLADMPVTLVRSSPSDRMELNAVRMLRGKPQSPWGTPVVVLMQPPLKGWNGVFKRAIDLVLATLATMLLSPLLAICALMIKLESPGPALFVQERAGYRNKPFRIFKFRSMYADRADLTGSQLTLRTDPRVTPFGSFLRRSSIDELPQLFNVLRGEMSLVGPRPHPKGAKAGGILYDVLIPNFYSRYRMKPGITGLAQISGQRGNTETKQHLLDRYQSDIRYAEEWTPLLDILIMFRTVSHLFKRTNAF